MPNVSNRSASLSLQTNGTVSRYLPLIPSVHVVEKTNSNFKWYFTFSQRCCWRSDGVLERFLAFRRIIVPAFIRSKRRKILAQRHGVTPQNNLFSTNFMVSAPYDSQENWTRRRHTPLERQLHSSAFQGCFVHACVQSVSHHFALSMNSVLAAAQP